MQQYATVCNILLHLVAFLQLTPPQKFFHIPRTPTYENVYRPENKETVVCAQRLLQLCQLPNKYSRKILR